MKFGMMMADKNYESTEQTFDLLCTFFILNDKLKKENTINESSF